MGETQYSHLQQASGTVVDILATTGVQQGDQAAMLLWNLALHPVLCRVKHSKQLLQGSPVLVAFCFTIQFAMTGEWIVSANLS